MAKPWIRTIDGVIHVHDGMLTRPVSSHQKGRSILAARAATMCLHASCHQQRGTNPYGVCDMHAPRPVAHRLLTGRIAQLEISHHLKDAA